MSGGVNKLETYEFFIAFVSFGLASNPWVELWLVIMRSLCIQFECVCRKREIHWHSLLNAHWLATAAYSCFGRFFFVFSPKETIYTNATLSAQSMKWKTEKKKTNYPSANFVHRIFFLSFDRFVCEMKGNNKSSDRRKSSITYFYTIEPFAFCCGCHCPVPSWSWSKIWSRRWRERERENARKNLLKLNWTIKIIGFRFGKFLFGFFFLLLRFYLAKPRIW